MTTRRTKGDGGLTQRKDGRWQATLPLELPNGRKTTKTMYGRTQAEAKRKLDQARRDRDKGTLVATSPTVAAWMGEWLEKKRRPPKSLKPQTWNGYESKVRTYIVPALGKRRLSDLKPRQVEALYDDMRARGLAESTVRQTHAIVQKALKDAVRLGVLGVSPMDRVSPPGTETGDRDQFALAEAAMALRAAGESARWWLALFYGMRQGEVLGMEWEHVDWTARVFSIEETRQNGYRGDGAGPILGDPKSKASRRPLPMLPQIEVRLRLHWEAAGRPTSGLVFPGPRGGLMDPKRDWSDWRAFLLGAGLPTIALHAARNTASSVMEAAGIPDRVVAQILGQAQVRTTHGYQRAELERLRGYMEQVGVVLELEG